LTAESLDGEQIENSFHPIQVDVLEVVGLDGGRLLSVTEIAFEVQRPRTTVGYHVRRLVGDRILGAWAPRGSRNARKRYFWSGGYAHRSSDPRTRRPVDQRMPSQLRRTYGEFLVEACALWTFLHEGRTEWTRAEFEEHVSLEIMEEGNQLSRAAIAVLYDAGLFWDDGGYVRCAVAITDLTEDGC
jgi:hypothetical protein